MNDYNFELFDPRGRSEGSASDRAARKGSGDKSSDEYKPRHPQKGLDSSGEYRPRHASKESSGTKSKKSSPSPVKEGGDDDFEVFNFDAARKRRLEREEKLNAQLAAQERPRELAQRMAERSPARPAHKTSSHSRSADSAVKRASDFVSRLSSYAAPVASASSKGGKSAPKGKSGSSRKGESLRTASAKTSSGGRKSFSQKKKTSNSAAEGSIRAWFAKLPGYGKAAVVCGCVLLALMFVYYSAFGVLLSGMNSLDLDRRNDQAASEVSGVELMSSSGVTNILLLGIDDDGGSGSRSDTIMLASLDARTSTIRLCSILRDCYVEIPGHGKSRINAAYAYGGVQLAVETVESNFRVEIDHCVTIDMAALVDVVDAMGGVEIELTSAEANQINLHSHCGLTTGSGLQLLNGKQAVTYAQIRKIDSDFMRTQRQRTLINAILTKMRSLGVGELMNLVEAVAPNVSTDMSSARIASLALKALPALSNELGQLTIPSEGKYSSVTIDGMAVLKLNLEANAKLLQSYIYGE